VPDVDATAVPDVITLDAIDCITAPEIVLFVSVCVASVPTKVVVASGKVTVRVLFVFGEVRVIDPVPLALPWTFKVLMFLP
jgi:hypothetical protein